jgi:NAD(P)H-flavin reductase/ferredoxin
MTRSYAIRLTTRDGKQLDFDCAAGENIVAAAASARIFLPVQCRAGACGTCRAICADGDYELAAYSPGSLPEDAARRREVLLCRTFPRGPLSIVLPYESSRIATEDTRPRLAEITALAAIGENTLRLVLTLEPDEALGSGAVFEPGQYMELILPESGVTRAYSLANTSNWDGQLEFLIRVQPGGRFSSWLSGAARPGGKLSVRGPFGSFVLNQGSPRPRGFVCGGTGLAPVLSMLRRMAEWQEPHQARLYFGVNHESELFLLPELERLAAELPKLLVDVCVWRPGPTWTGFAGSPVDALRRDLEAGALAAPDLYVCGPPGLIDATEALARRCGIGEDRVFSEKFLPGEVPTGLPADPPGG